MIKGVKRHKIDIYGKVEFTNELGEKTYGYDIVKSPWAEIIPQTGKMQKAQADTILTSVTHKMEINYVKGLTNEENKKRSFYIMFRGNRFYIKHILNPYFQNKKLEIFVEEVST